MDVVREAHGVLEPHVYRKEALASTVHMRVEHAQDRTILDLRGHVEIIGTDAGMWLPFHFY